MTARLILCFHSFSVEETIRGSPVCFRGYRKIKLEEIFGICIQSKVSNAKVCDRVPSGIKESAIFVVNVGEGGVPIQDLTADDNGVYRSSCPSDVFNIKIRNNEVTHFDYVREGDEIDKDRLYTLHRNYGRHQSNQDFKRIITTIRHAGKVCPYAIIQYRVPANSSIFVKPHGLAQKYSEPFRKTKKTVFDKIAFSSSAPKFVVKEIDDDNGGIQNLKSSSDHVRNRRQIYNHRAYNNGSLEKKFRSTGPPKVPDFSKLASRQLSEDFTKDVSYGVNTDKYGRTESFPSTFAGTNTTLFWLKEFCSAEKTSSVAGIDVTYHNGPFYCTSINIENPMFLYANDQSKHPTTTCAIMTSVTKTTIDYFYMAQQCKKFGIKSLSYITDRELALETGFEDMYPIEDGTNNHLLCFTHVEMDVKEKLRELVSDAENARIRLEILGSERDGKRTKGLVDCDSEEDFEQQYVELAANWPGQFRNWMETKEFRKRSLKDALKFCMLKPVRERAGLGHPPNKCTNQRTESFNTVLKQTADRQKVDQVTFHEIVYEKIFKQQENEYIRAVAGLGEYRLAVAYRKYSLDPSEVAVMTNKQKEAHIDKIFKGMAVTPSNDPFLEVLAPKMLSVSIKDSGITNLSNFLLTRMWRQAEVILSNYTVQDVGLGVFSVAQLGCTTDVKTNEQGGGITCTCKHFIDIGGLCCHALVVAEKLKLCNFLKHYRMKKNAPSKAMHKKMKNVAV